MTAICKNQSTLKKVTLVCNKCGTRFITKNIGCIGARTILPEKEDCEHNIRDLEVICSEELDIESFKQELRLYERQGRDKDNIDDIFVRDYGKTPAEMGIV